jgi:hypothetical protein
MNELQTENEKPLLVVKYRLAHKLFEMVLIYPWLILIGGGFIVKCFNNAVINMCTFKSVFGAIFFGLLGLAALYMFLELLFFRKVVIYKDRIEKVYYLLGRRKFFFKDTRLHEGGTAPILMVLLSISSNSRKNYLSYLYGMRIAMHLLSKENRSKVYQTLALVSGRTEQEIREVGFEGIKPFLKNEIKTNIGE